MNDKATILAVDDTSESLSLLARILGSAGYQVQPADSGELALAAVAAAPPDLILLDVKMRGIDGLDVCRRLKASAETRHIPVVLVSASTEMRERIEGLRVGAADFITKPFHTEELLMRVKMHLALSRATASLERQAAALSIANSQLQSEITKRQSIEAELRHSLAQAERSRRAMLSTLEDQRHAEEALHRSEAQYRSLSENSPDLIARFDRQYRHLYVNAAAAASGRLTADDYVGKTMVESGVPEAEARKWEERVRTVFETGQPVGVIDSFETQDGVRRFNTKLVPEFAPDGSVRSVQSVARDVTEQMQVEEALRESEERYRSIFNNSIEGIYRTTPEGRHITVNPAFAHMFGYTSPQEMIATVTNIGEELYVHPEDRLRLIALMSASDGMVRNFGAQLKRHDGSKFCVSISARMHKDANGKATFIEGTCVDVTDRMRAEMALKASEERFHGLFNEMTEGMAIHECIFDGQGNCVDYRIFDVNPAFEKHTGLSTAAVHGRLASEAYGGKAPFLDIYGNVAVTRVPISFEAYFEPLRRHFKISAFSPEPGSFATVFSDITDRLRAEESLRNKSAVDNALASLAAQILTPNEPVEMTAAVVLRNAQALTDSSQGFVSSIDPKSGNNVAHTLTKMLGRNDDVKDRDPRIIFPVSPDGHYPGLSGHALNTRMPFFTNDAPKHSSYVSLPHGHAPIRNFLAVPVLVQDELLGEIVLSGSSRDYNDVDVVNVHRMAELYGMYLRDRITREKLSHSEAQLRQAQKMEAVGRLAGGVAHDFNNMLQVILSSTEIALPQTESGSQVNDCLIEIRKAGERSADLTRQLLAFARKQTIAPKLIDLNDGVTRVLKMLGRLIGEDISLVWKPSKMPIHVKIDPAQLDQILANLAVNSRDAITGVGSITIETSLVEIGKDDASPGLIPGKYGVLSVTDDGCGMGKKTIDNIFEPFFTTKALGRGTGLGLATIYGIVKQNNGYISVYSEPGKGTTFRIYLPRCGEQVAPSAANGVKPQVPTGTETVLLVEDEPTLLVIISQFLERLGYTVLASGNPISALQLAERHSGKVDLLMTDVVMPDMSGHELWRNVSARWRGVKCLYMSGYPANVIASQGILEDGANFLQKPFSVNALATKLREVLDSNEL